MLLVSFATQVIGFFWFVNYDLATIDSRYGPLFGNLWIEVAFGTIENFKKQEFATVPVCSVPLFLTGRKTDFTTPTVSLFLVRGLGRYS